MANRRPGSVTLVALWAAIGGALNLLGSFGALLVAVGFAGSQLALLAILVGVVQFFVGMGLLIVSGGLFKLHSWARTVGMVAFGTLAVLNLFSLLGGDVLSALSLVLNGGSLVILLTNRDAFVTDRPDVEEARETSRSRYR